MSKKLISWTVMVSMCLSISFTPTAGFGIEIADPSVVPVEGFAKEVEQRRFNPGDTLDYTISFKLPKESKGYKGLLIYDQLPEGLIYKSSSAKIKIPTSSDILLAPIQKEGAISLFITKEQIQANESREVQMVIKTEVDCAWSKGNIKNKAEVYAQTTGNMPVPGQDKPQDEDSVTSRPLALVENFQNKASESRFCVGGTLAYTISFRLPQDATAYEGLLIHDELPGTLNYESSSAKIRTSAGNDVALTPKQNSKKVSLEITKAQLKDYEGQEVQLVIQTEVNNTWMSGNIKNKAEAYAQAGNTLPVPGKDIPQVYDSVTVEPMATVKNFINKADPDNFTVPGDTVVYTISAKLPEDATGYEGLLVNDELPGTLTYRDSSARIKVPGENNILLTPTQNGGRIRLMLTRDQIQANEGKEFELVIRTEVNNTWNGGDINNKAEFYAQTKSIRPIPGSTAPLGESSATIKPVTHLPNFKKVVTQGRLSVVGAPMNYLISFNLPQDVGGYEGLLVHDELPATLTYKDSNAKIKVPGGNDIPLTSIQNNGRVRLNLTKQQLQDHKGKAVELIVQTEINKSWTGKDVENTAEYYAQTKSIRPIPGITIPLGLSKVTTSKETTVNQSGNPNPKSVGTVSNLKGKGLSYQTIKLSWKKAKNATGYEIFRYNAKKKKYKKVETVNSLTPVFKNTNLQSNKAYTYKIRAFRTEEGKTSRSGFSKAITTKTQKTGPQKIVAKAKTKLGCPYKGGAAGPNAFDCSGFVYWTFKTAGAKTKKKVARSSTSGMYSSLKKYTVAKGLGGMKKAKTGDIILFKRGGGFSHAAIYIGNGKLIHSTRPGKVVKIQKVSTIHNSGTRVAVFIRVAKK